MTVDDDDDAGRRARGHASRQALELRRLKANVKLCQTNASNSSDGDAAVVHRCKKKRFLRFFYSGHSFTFLTFFIFLYFLYFSNVFYFLETFI